MDLEGKVEAVSGTCPVLSFQLQGYSVRTSSTTEFAKGPCKDLKNGKAITLRGELVQPGVVNAIRIEFNK